MTPAEKKAVCQVLMEVMLMGGTNTLSACKPRAGLSHHVMLTDYGVVSKIGTDKWQVTEKGKQFVLDMDTDSCSSPEE